MKYYSLNLIELNEQELFEIKSNVQVLVFNVHSCMYHIDFVLNIRKDLKNVRLRDLLINSRRYFLFGSELTNK